MKKEPKSENLTKNQKLFLASFGCALLTMHLMISTLFEYYTYVDIKKHNAQLIQLRKEFYKHEIKIKERIIDTRNGG